jgi:hypothetical protein
MLPHDHPSSFCHLFGMTDMEHFLVLQALSAMKEWGPMKIVTLLRRASVSSLICVLSLLPLKQIKAFHHPCPKDTGHSLLEEVTVVALACPPSATKSTRAFCRLCEACKKEDRNLKYRQNNYKVEHGHAANSTNLDSLLKSPDYSQIKARFGDRKRQVMSKDQRIKQLEDTIQKMKSKEHEVKTKIPTVGENGRKPGAIQGILANIMDSVVDVEKGMPNEKKKKQQARDEIVMFLLNDAQEDEEKGSPYNIEGA